MPDILDSLYDDLKGQGYLQKDKLTFRRYMMASGADGYKNRKALYDDLKGQGYLNSPTYEDFASRIFSSVAKGWTPSQSGNRRPQAAPRRVNSQNTGVRNREVEAGGARSAVPQGFGDLDMQSASWGALGQTMPEKVAEHKKRVEESYGWTDDLAGATRRAHDTATHKAVKGDREAQKKLGVDRAMQQHRDRLDYARETGEELRHNISTGGVDEKTGEAFGFDETRFGIAPTVARDEQGNILYGEDGKPLVGLASDDVRSGVQQVEQERVYREDLDRKINEARAEQERIEQLLNQRSEQLLAKHREKEGNKSFWQRTLEGMSSGDPMFQRQQDFGLATDNEFLTLQSALHENERYIKELEAARENAGFWRGTANVLTDPSTYSFGLTDLFDATSLSRIGNKIEMAREDGIAPNLTESEEALAFNYLLKREAEGLNADKKWYHRGQGFGHTISFMKDFALSGGGFANLAKQGMSLGTKAGTKLATRMLGDYMKKNLGTKALGKTIIYSSKGLGLAAGAEVGGFALNNTVQAASSIADIVNRRTGELAVGQDGNLTVEGGMSLASAFLTSQLSRTGENASELVGLGFDAIPGILGKVIQRTTTGKFLKKLADNKFWKGAEGTLNYLGVQSVWGELMEEEYGMARTELLNRITNGRFAPEGSGLFDAEKQLETAITVGLTSMLLRVPSMVVSGASTANYYANKYNLNSSDRQMRTVFGDDARYQSVKSMIDGADNKQMAGVLNRLMNTAWLSSDEKQSMFMYANDLVKLRGFNMGNVVAAANGYTEPPRVSGYHVKGNTVEEVDQDGNVLSTHEYEDREAMKAGLYELQQQRFDKTLQDDLGIMRARPDGQYDALVEQYCQQAGITTEEFDAMLNKPSMERDEAEQQLVAPFADLLHNSVYDNTVLHEEQSRQDGEDIADADSIDLEEGGEQGVDMASQWAEAQEVRRVAFERNENLKEEVERMEAAGFSPQEVIAQLETFRPEEVESVIGYYNAKAKFEGYMNRKSEKIDEEARNSRERHTFKGTVNGQADLRNVYTITDGVNEYFLVSGNLTTDPDGKITGSDSGLIICLDSDGSFVQLSETDGYSVMPVAQSLDEFEEAERIRFQEQVSAAIDPEGRLNTSVEEAPSNIEAQEQAPEEVSEPASEAQQQVEIPIDEKTGVKLYEQGVPIELAIADMQADGLDVNEEADLAIGEAQSELDKIKNPKTRAERVKNDARRKELQNTIDYYTALKEQYSRGGESEENINVQPEVPEWRDDTPQAARERGYKKIEGQIVERQEEKTMPQGMEVEVQYSTKDKAKGRLTVSELSDVQGSHLTNGQRNEKHFLPEAQPKAEFGTDRQLAAQTNANESNFRPELMLTFNGVQSAYSGSTSQTNRRGEVIQGNGRRNLAEYIYAPGNEAVARKYKDFLKAHAEELGTTAEAIEQMEKPYAHIVLDVTDEEAIRLGQFTAADLESGGKRVPEVSTVTTKLGDKYSTLANIVLQHEDPDASLAERVDGNAEAAVKWLNQGGYINDTEAKTLLEDKNLARQFVKDLLTDQLFKGAHPDLRTMFYELPKNIQSAIISAVGREVGLSADKSILKDIQDSIRAYHELMVSSKQFAGIQGNDFEKRYAAATEAVNDWLRQINMDGSLNQGKFNNFALTLAKLYRSLKDQKTLAGRLREYYDLVSGATREIDMFGDGVAAGVQTKEDAIRTVFGIDYDGRQRTVPLAGDNQSSEEGRGDGSGSTESGEREPEGTRTADNRGGDSGNAREVGQEEIQPIGTGDFGEIYDQFRGKPKEATVLEKKNSALDNTTDTGKTSDRGKRNDTATPQSTVSESKGTENPETNQEKSEEKAKIDTSDPMAAIEQAARGIEERGSRSGNKIFTDEAHDEVLRKLRAKFSNLNAGFDPEIALLMLQDAGYHIERGARKIADCAKAMIEELGDFVRPYIKSAYNAVRDYPGMEEIRKDMSSHEEVEAFDEKNFDQNVLPSEEKSVNLQVSNEEREARKKFVAEVTNTLMGALRTNERPFKSIADLRNFAREHGMDVDLEGRDDILLQELVEDALVKAARNITYLQYGGELTTELFEEIKKLYDLQPTISQRSSNRIKMQQYSTPLPMSFVAQAFVGSENERVLEPTAGNGMLVFGLKSKTVHANELDETRLENLQGLGFGKVTKQDATLPFEGEEQYDAVIANPPFGSAEAKEYDGKMIPGLAEQIALNALSKMKDGGRAAIIIGGNTEWEANGAIKNQKAFMTYLYDHYNVKGVIDMDGKLYQKQGTTYPTRMILIDGRRSEEERAQTKVYPPIKDNAPRKATSFDELYDIAEELRTSNRNSNGNEQPRVLRSTEQAAEPVVRNTSRQADKSRLDSQSENGNREVERVRGGLDSRPEGVLVSESRNDNANRGRKSSGEREGDLFSDRGYVRPGDKRVENGNDSSGSGSRGGTSTSGRGTDGLSDGRGRGNNNSSTDNNVGTPIRRTVSVKEEKRELGSDKLSYRPHNTAFSLESVAPAAMVEAMDNMLSKIEKEHGDIETWLQSELGYGTLKELHDALAAEQVDSVAMAIYQMQQGQGMIIGDQTGVGKGRQMAALIRWAVRQGKKPIFITKDSDLFSDIYRDLVDVGSGELKPFIFNDKGPDKKTVKITDSDGNVVYTTLSKPKKEKIWGMDKLPDEYDYAILSYSQMNTGDSVSQEESGKAAKESGKRAKKGKAVKAGRATPKADFLRKIAKDNYLLMDESHNAAGEGNTGAYFQSILKDAKAVTFASATFAKRPDTMPMYSLRTAMAKAKVKANELIEIIEAGGVTLQEIMSRALTQAGQMVRRERDMSDVKTDWKTVADPAIVKKARENYDKTIAAFNAIIDFQRTYVGNYLDRLSKDLADVASSAGMRQGTEDLGIKNVPFASKTYNYTKQLMLALKVDAIVDEVVKEIEAGRHPVIALENTMGSMIDGYAPGDTLDETTFAASLLKGLRGVLRYTITDEDGRKIQQELTPEQLGEEGARAYREVENLIRESTSGIFISPLDAITEKLEAKGFRVGEISGRNTIARLNDDGKYEVYKRNEKDRKKVARDFNNGDLDVIIINKSGSTGISLHASERKSVRDKRQRTMIIAQPLADINDYMQMIGRIDRTGQVHRGYYINLGLPVPAEGRFLMMLSTKLKSLNANTTTSQESESNDVDAPDLLNKYGSQVVIEYLRDNPDIYVKMGEPLKKEKTTVSVNELDSYEAQEDDARKITGYVALLPTAEQDAFYDDVVRRYTELIQYLDDTGSNDLKISVMPLRARTIDKDISSEGVDPSGNNPFAGHAYVEWVEMDVLKKPMKAAEVEKTIGQLNPEASDGTNGVDGVTSRVQQIIDTVEREADAKLQKEEARYETAKQKAEEDIAARTETINKQEKRTEEQKREAIADYSENRRQTVEESHSNMVNKIRSGRQNLLRYLRIFKVGGSVLVPDDLTTDTFMGSSPGIFCGFKAKDEGVTPSTTLAVFATLDGRRKIEVKLSDWQAIARIDRMTQDNWDAAQRVTLSNWDSEIPTETRRRGYIMTGNILQAFSDTSKDGKIPGQLVTFTDIDGNVRDGILMNQKWEPTQLNSSNVPLSMRMDEVVNLPISKTLVSADGEVAISHWYGTYVISVPKSKKAGGKYYNDERLLDLADGRVFYPRAGRLAADIPEGKIRDAVNVLSELGVQMASERQVSFDTAEQQSDRRFDEDENTSENPHITHHKSRIAKHIAALAKKLGTQNRTTVYTSFDELPAEMKEHIRKRERQGRKVRGWYENGRVYLYLPHIDSVYQAEKTIWHETVAHLGLRELVGKENLDKLLRKLWLTHKDGDMGKWVTERMQTNGWSLNEAIEEYLAREAEKNPFKEYSLWQRLKWMLAEVLHRMGFTSDPTVSDVQYLFWVSQNRLRNNDPMAMIAQQAFRFNLERAATNAPFVNMNAKTVKDIYNQPTEAEAADADKRLNSMTNAVFVSNALSAVTKIKQEKATPEQWLKMIEKNGGLKAGEDKWLGLSEWLKGSDAKTLTKQEVLDFINENKIQIEEVHYADIDADKLFVEEEDAYRLKGDENTYINKNGAAYVDGKYIGSYNIDDGKARIAREKGVGERPLNDTRLQYTTKGLENKHEIALTVPTIEPWNESDDIHFGEAGGGRAVAWVRFGETTDADGRRVLVIDEIQSKRHQEGREKGYRTAEAVAEEERLGDAVNEAQEAYDAYTRKMGEKYDGAYEDIYAEMTDAERAEADRLEQEVYAASERLQNHDVSGVPDAPFEKNWHELAMKRMLRYAAENGYDKIAWTTGEQQAERYDLGRTVQKISSGKWDKWNEDDVETKYITIDTTRGDTLNFEVDRNGIVTKVESEAERFGVKIGSQLSDIVGKDLSKELLLEEPKFLRDNDLRIGGEGMKGFYDQMLPRFMDKYGKPWGVKTQDITLPNIGDKGLSMHSVDVTPQMKESVMEGQPMFDEDIDGPMEHSAKEIYDRRLNTISYVATEAYQDAMVSLKTAQNAIAHDKAIPDSQNAYMAENLMHGKNKNEQDLFNQMFRDPLIETINKIMNLTGMNWGDIDRYVYTKSGLERNREFFVRDNAPQPPEGGGASVAERWQELKDDRYADLQAGVITFPEYLESLDQFIRENIDEGYNPSEHDYSGFRDMFGDEEGKYDEAEVISELMDAEDQIEAENVDTLWEQINAATRYGLERYREAGMRSDEQIDQTEGMFHWYVPMRGFKEERGEDMYQYFTQKGSAKSYVGGLLKHAKGRGSEANYPISTIFAMTYKAISDCNQNLVNQKLYRLCQANPNDLIVLSDSWAVLNEVTEEWEEVGPEIPEDASEEDVRQATLAFEERMKQLASEKKARKITGKARFDYKPMDKKKQSEHVVEVRINGQPRKMIVVGNPRMAQALNGQLRFERGKNVFSKWNNAVKNFMASVFTSYSPTFALRNMMRDWTHFRMMLGVREGKRYAKQASKYYRQSLFKMVGMFKKYREGTLDMNKEMERDFKDFMDNGGVTGFVQMQKIDDIQKEMEKLYKQQKQGKTIRLNNALWDNTLGAIEALNEGIENNARFATFRASRHYAGRTKARSAYDAKEITVNFNKKGAGSKTMGFKSGNKKVEDAAKAFGVTSQVLGEGRIFFNATVQAIATTFKNFQNADGSLNKGYIAKWAARYAAPPFLFGLALPYINMALAAALGGDDDDPYANLPEWTRRKNLCIYIGGGNFLTIPVGQELAAFLALGDVVAGNTYAPNLKPVNRSYVDEMVDVMNTFSPVDMNTKITHGGLMEDPVDEVAGRTFSVLAPLVAVGQNLSWTGRPIYREDRYQNDQHTPEYQMVYQNVNPVLVEASRLLHELGGGDDVTRGKLEVNPAIVQYLWEQYTGGPGKVFSNTISIGKDARDILSGNESDFNIRKVEGLKAFVQQGDDRTQYYRTQAKYFKYKADAEKLHHDVEGYEKAAEENPEYLLKLEEISKGTDFVRMQIVREADKELSKINKAANAASGNERRELRRIYNENVKKIVNVLDEIGYPAGFGGRVALKKQMNEIQQGGD